MGSASIFRAKLLKRFQKYLILELRISFSGDMAREHYDCSDVSQTHDIFYPVFTTQDK